LAESSVRIRLEQYRRFLATCWEFVGPERKLFLVFIAISVFGALTEGIGISLFVPLIDSISQTSSFADIPLLARISSAFNGVPTEMRIPLVAGLMFVVVVIRGVVQTATQFLNIYLPVRVEQRLRHDSFDCLLRTSLELVNARKSGELQNYIGGYPTRIGQVMMYLGSLFSNAAMLAIYTMMMLLISISLTLVALLFMTAMFYLQRHFSSGTLRRAGSEVSSSSEQVSQVVWEVLGGLTLIRLCVAGPLMFARYREALAGLLATQTRYAYASALVTPLYATASGTLICVLLFAAFVTGKSGHDTVALVLLFLFLLQRLLGPMSAITTSRNAILLHMEAMFDFGAWIENSSTQFQKDGEAEFITLKKGIRFTNVTFSYNAESGAVLKRLSFSIPQNKTVAIVGPSGAGKSTVVSLLGRLYDPQSGAVLVDDVDVRDYRIDSWRKRLSVVSQSIFLLNDTVERNLTFGLTRSVAESEVRRAAELAACSLFIEELPQGYQTVLGERGIRLSGGQQQRIAIARAILADPQVLILDEATSHLDSITEHAVQQAINSFRSGRTLIVIAHRMSTIRRADKIIVLDDGELVEEGTHETLMRSRGRYRELIEHQKLDIVDLVREEMAAS
jgi:ABC-type multidrug transport system fused ATPase/permease subunit